MLVCLRWNDVFVYISLASTRREFHALAQLRRPHSFNAEPNTRPTEKTLTLGRAAMGFNALRVRRHPLALPLLCRYTRDAGRCSPRKGRACKEYAEIVVVGIMLACNILLWRCCVLCCAKVGGNIAGWFNRLLCILFLSGVRESLRVRETYRVGEIYERECEWERDG